MSEWEEMMTDEMEVSDTDKMEVRGTDKETGSISLDTHMAAADAEENSYDEGTQNFQSTESGNLTQEEMMKADTDMETTGGRGEEKHPVVSTEYKRAGNGNDSLEKADTAKYNKVEFTVCISLGVINKQTMPTAVPKEKKKTKVEAPKPISFHHVEFKLLPTNEEMTQVDIVLYNFFARVFVDKMEAKTCKPYYTNTVAWISWNQTFEVNVSDDLLLRMFDFTIEFRLWDNKEKMMTRTRFDKPRGLKYDIDDVEIKKHVLKQQEILSQLEKYNVATYKTADLNESMSQSGDSTDTKDSPQNTDRSQNWSLSQSTRNVPALSQDKQSTMSSENKQISPRKAGSNRKDKGLSKLTFKMCYFFSDMHSITRHLPKKVPGLADMLVSLAINGSLLSTEQKRKFNPMVICIHSLKDMPGEFPKEGATYSELRAKCHPVFMKYQFLHSQPYVSAGRPHQKDIYFDDINVILTGTMDMLELREFFRGPGLEIEVHDRDRKPIKSTQRPLLFGDDLNDEKFSNIGVVTSKKTQTNPYEPPVNLSDSYGVCRLNLSDFTLGNQFIHQKLPLLNHLAPDSVLATDVENTNFNETENNNSKNKTGAFPVGQYMQCCSMIKLTVKLAYPLMTHSEIAANRTLIPTCTCPFSRMVFRIDKNQEQFLKDVLLTVARLNGQALGLDDVTEHILIATLSKLNLTSHQRVDRLLDIITGFHVMDQDMQLLVVEGLQNRALKKLIEHFGSTDLPGVDILFSTDLVCTDRLYTSFNLDMWKVKLHEPLAVIVQQPLLYVRDMVPRPCFHALIQIFQLTQCKRLLDAIRNNLFPLAEMVRSMSKEFGVVITEEDLKMKAMVTLNGHRKSNGVLFDKDILAEETAEEKSVMKWRHTDTCNTFYIGLLKERSQHEDTVDFIARNVQLIQHQSEENKAKMEVEKTVEIQGPLKDVHIYAVNTYNSVELAKQELRHQMDRHSLYSYCPEFQHSMTFPPVDLTSLYREQEDLSKRLWKTQSGWVFPGFKTAMQSHTQTHKPSQCRLEEISQPYQDPADYERRDKTHCGRNYYTWTDRKDDMDIWRRPVPDLSEKVHIMPISGEQRHLLKEHRQKEFDCWKSKVVVANVRGKFHRLLTDTELQVQGRKAACQLDRLKGLLKDKPQRKAFRFCSVSDLPSFGVVNYPELNGKFGNKQKACSYVSSHPCYQTNAFIPGSQWPERSLTLYRNQTPIHDYEHNKFIKLKGQDFKTVHTTRRPTSSGPPVTAVSQEEKYADFSNQLSSFQRCHTLPIVNCHNRLKPLTTAGPRHSTCLNGSVKQK